MNAFVWFGHEIRSEYIAFAETEEEAKNILRETYDPKELEEKLFYRSPQIRPMPKGCVSWSNQVIWLPKQD